MEGIDLSPGTLLAGLLVSSIGMGLFLFGKKSERLPQLVAGIALMGFPYFVQGTVETLSVGALLLTGLWVSLRLGA